MTAAHASTRVDPPCRLCGALTPLRNSHILPEFVYVPIYDAKHKGYLIDPMAPGAANPRKFQKGFRERMLCGDCEHLLNDNYERHFKELWFDRRILRPLETNEFGILQCGDYARFKLFHLSVLLRADLATRTFTEVELGARHRSRLREMILNGDPGDPEEYPIVCFAVSEPDTGGVWWAWVSSPNPGRLDGVRCYQFTFGGCSWLYFVSSHGLPLIRKIALRPDGTLPVAKRTWLGLKRFAPRAAAEWARRKG